MIASCFVSDILDSITDLAKPDYTYGRMLPSGNQPKHQPSVPSGRNTLNLSLENHVTNYNTHAYYMPGRLHVPPAQLGNSNARHRVYTLTRSKCKMSSFLRAKGSEVSGCRLCKKKPLLLPFPAHIRRGVEPTMITHCGHQEACACDVNTTCRISLESFPCVLCGDQGPYPSNH